MTGWPDQPVIYEINTAIWLGGLSRAAGRRVTLADVPTSAWDDVTPAGTDAVWLIGVWERSPAGLELATANAGLQATVASHRVRAGAWQLHEVGGWPDNDSCRNLLAWSWAADGAGGGVADDAGRHVVVVNLSGEPADGRVRLGWTDLRGRSWKLTDLLDDREFDWSGDELADQGLFVALPPWGCHLLAMLLPQPAGSAGFSGGS
jgi:hypothetical protein